VNYPSFDLQWADSFIPVIIFQHLPENVDGDTGRKCLDKSYYFSCFESFRKAVEALSVALEACR